MTDSLVALKADLARQAERIRVLDELAEINRGLMVLSMELEDRVAHRTEELSRALAALYETEDRRDFALGVTHIGTWDISLADGVIQCSPEIDRIFGNDLRTQAASSPGVREARRRGLRAAAALPLGAGAEIKGALTLYAREEGFFDDDQVRLLKEMASDIAFALKKFEEEGYRRRAESERESALEKLGKSLESTILTLARTIETRDPYTAGHQQRVRQLAVAIAERMALDPSRIEGLGFGALIHDIGKIAVPSELLISPRRLTHLEMKLIRTHAEQGYEIMKDIDLPWPVAQMILQHHERQDGSGYPRGLKGGAILQEARILAMADVVEAMSSHRPYRPGLGVDKALEHILEFHGILFDAQAVDACRALFRDQGFTFTSAF